MSSLAPHRFPPQHICLWSFQSSLCWWSSDQILRLSWCVFWSCWSSAERISRFWDGGVDWSPICPQCPSGKTNPQLLWGHKNSKCIIFFNLYVVIFAVYIDPNCNGWNINQIVFQKDSFHKKEIYFLLLYIYLQISCERCATYELLLNLPQYCILSWDTINRHNISTSNILMGAVFFAFSARKGLYLSLFLGKWKEREC